MAVSLAFGGFYIFRSRLGLSLIDLALTVRFLAESFEVKSLWQKDLQCLCRNVCGKKF